ncbi:2OG-Fe(II) oxygenase [Luteimonas sp. MJ246]|uniref:2OG-Fe(II) oxygenase n=1 Tax=Luteimonas sp. MJ174 TaxID=3129237 RepID=UPI0031B9ADC2
MTPGNAFTEIVAPGVGAQAVAIRERFLTAAPFRHCVIEGFFAPEFVDALLAQFPAFERGNAVNEDGVVSGKSTVERIRGLGEAYARLDACIQSPAFLDLVGRLTGIDDLLYDPGYFGGGTHENRDGQSLDNHIDFNHHPATGWHRRLNLIVYLNPDWHDDWGGALELHRDPHDPAADEVVSLAPAYNRCVIFETTEHSWHGFPPIRLPPERAGLTRRSIALYFYTRERPADEVASSHSTVYVDRPLPAHVTAGRVLTGRDVEELRELLARRDAHNRRLYADMRALQAELDRSFAGRLFAAARRVRARFRR